MHAKVIGNKNTPQLPVAAGLGLKPQFFHEIFSSWPEIGFFEVHAENYLSDSPILLGNLERIRDHYPLSIHGVALSLGGKEPLDLRHLSLLKQLLHSFEPSAFSEHLAWCSTQGGFYNDLLPIAYTEENLKRVCEHLEQAQEVLNWQIMIENPATYVQFRSSVMSEPAFITEIIKRTGCGLLLDINNIYVTCVNHNLDARQYIASLPLSHVGEIHMAGFHRQSDGNDDPLLIDNHGAEVADEVWELYDYSLSLIGPVATLLERDNNIPPLATLLSEAKLMQDRLFGIDKDRE